VRPPAGSGYMYIATVYLCCTSAAVQCSHAAIMSHYHRLCASCPPPGPYRPRLSTPVTPLTHLHCLPPCPPPSPPGNPVGKPTGGFGLETLLLQMALKIIQPNRVFLMRSKSTTRSASSLACSFTKELKAKYGEQEGEVGGWVVAGWLLPMCQAPGGSEYNQSGAAC
jgi:hypothetical protein